MKKRAKLATLVALILISMLTIAPTLASARQKIVVIDAGHQASCSQIAHRAKKAWLQGHHGAHNK